MDDERVGTSSNVETMTIGQFIVDQAPRYMAMGVSYDEYWNGDYTRLPYYRKAHQQKREEKNFELWLQGWYFLQAIACIVPKSEAVYPAEPIPLTQAEAENLEEKQRQKEIDNARAYMEAAMHNINKTRKEKGGTSDGG